MDTVMQWIGAGAIGKLQEVHNWTNRPVWPVSRSSERTGVDTGRIQLGSGWA